MEGGRRGGGGAKVDLTNDLGVPVNHSGPFPPYSGALCETTAAPPVPPDAPSGDSEEL